MSSGSELAAEDPGRWYRWRFIAAAVILAALPIREVVREASRARDAETPLDVALAPLVAALPPAGSVGWAGDGPTPHDAATARARLQFVAVPRILAFGPDGAAVVVAWASDEERLTRLLLAHRLSIRALFERGYVLCVSEGP